MFPFQDTRLPVHIAAETISRGYVVKMFLNTWLLVSCIAYTYYARARTKRSGIKFAVSNIVQAALQRNRPTKHNLALQSICSLGDTSLVSEILQKQKIRFAITCITCHTFGTVWRQPEASCSFFSSFFFVILLCARISLRAFDSWMVSSGSEGRSGIFC